MFPVSDTWDAVRVADWFEVLQKLGSAVFAAQTIIGGLQEPLPVGCEAPTFFAFGKLEFFFSSCGYGFMECCEDGAVSV